MKLVTKEDLFSDLEFFIVLGGMSIVFMLLFLGSSVSFYPDTYNNVTSSLNKSINILSNTVYKMEMRFFESGIKHPKIFFYITYLFFAFFIYLLIDFIIKLIRFFRQNLQVLKGGENDGQKYRKK